MFDIGFTELLLIAVVALVVLGPERLPKAARFAGLWVRRARAQWYSVKSELERELAADELKRSLHDARQAAADLHKTMQETEAEVQAKVSAAEAEARREIESLRRQVGAATDTAATAPGILTTDPAAYTAPQDHDTGLQAIAAPAAAEGIPADTAGDGTASAHDASAHRGDADDTDGDDGRQR
ncbi:Sec-independent protein translocase protein TatB [Luteimonas sp. A611]